MKYRIEVEINIDVRPYFGEDYDDSKPHEISLEVYEWEQVHQVMGTIYKYALENHMNWMSNPDLNHHYEAAKHHLQIDQEIAKQIAENFKVTRIEE